jgi:hypothetical protein
MSQDVDLVAHGKFVRQIDPGDADFAKPVVHLTNESLCHLTLPVSDPHVGQIGNLPHLLG